MREHLKTKLVNLPQNPGVYLMKDRKGKIIYVGKAKCLKNRVASYFQSRGAQDAKTVALVSKVADIDLLVTDSEVEALILEANLVKEHKPHYNVNLKDDKRYPYLKLTVAEPFPRLSVTRRVKRDGSRYFGPYTNAVGMRRTMRFLMKHFGLRSCDYEIPSSSGRQYRVCLDYHIGRCGGPCEALESPEPYRRHVKAVIMFLCGRRTDLIRQLRAEMATLSDEMKFEVAARIRDTIEALESVQQKQKVDAAADIDRDVIAFARAGSDAAMVVLQIREGILIGRQDFHLRVDTSLPNAELLSGFIKQYYNYAENLPQEIYLPGAVDDPILFERWLTQAKGSKVNLISPQKGAKYRLVGMAETNARLLLDEMLLQRNKYKERVSSSALALQQFLHLEKAPVTIACFDVSNLGPTDKAAALVCFEKSKPKKSQYRHFRVKTVEGQDDFAAMREVFTRYIKRCQREKLPLPDLMMVDGGKGQLAVAKEVLKEFGFAAQPVIGLAKKLEEVFLPGQSSPVGIPKASPALNLLKRVRDEAHRFAVAYHRQLRTKRTILSELDAVGGVGPARRTTLLRHFGSTAKLKGASLNEIESVKGISGALARKIFDHLHRPV